MQEPLKRRASVFAAQVESFIKTAELVKPKIFLRRERVEPKLAPVMERYVSSCSRVDRQLQNMLNRVQRKSPDPDLEAKLAKAIERLAELKKPYI